MIGKSVMKGGPDHRQAKRQPANQNGTYPGFLRQNNPRGIRVSEGRTLLTGRKTESSYRPGNPAANAVRVIQALSGKSAGYPGPLSIVMPQCPERFDQRRRVR